MGWMTSSLRVNVPHAGSYLTAETGQTGTLGIASTASQPTTTVTPTFRPSLLLHRSGGAGLIPVRSPVCLLNPQPTNPQSATRVAQCMPKGPSNGILCNSPSPQLAPAPAPAVLLQYILRSTAVYDGTQATTITTNTSTLPMRKEKDGQRAKKKKSLSPTRDATWIPRVPRVPRMSVKNAQSDVTGRRETKLDLLLNQARPAQLCNSMDTSEPHCPGR